jgi:hypothetical protein
MSPMVGAQTDSRRFHTGSAVNHLGHVGQRDGPVRFTNTIALVFVMERVSTTEQLRRNALQLCT